MSELGDLLELLHTGGTGDQSVQATIATWSHRERAHAAFVAEAEASRTVTLYAEGVDDAPAERSSTVRLWLAPPDRAREEDDEGAIAVRRGGLWWRYSPGEGAMSNEEEPEVGTSVGDGYAYLFDPGSLLGALVLEPRGTGELRGRSVVRAVARPRPSADDDGRDWTLHALAFGADGWQIAVDAELGVLLSVESLRDGVPFSRVEVVDLTVGEPIDDDVFVFVPPAGETIEPLDMPAADHALSVDELARRAPFAVFVPDALGAGWELDLVFQPGSARRGIPPTAYATVRSEDGHWSASVAQTAVGDGDHDERFDSLDLPEHWRTEARGGRELRVREPPESWATALVRMELEGTHIQLASRDLSVDRLADLAARLVRAPTQSPGWG